MSKILKLRKLLNDEEVKVDKILKHSIIFVYHRKKLLTQPLDYSITAMLLYKMQCFA